MLLFSTARVHTGADRKARLPDEPTGTFVAIGESLLGPWDIAGAQVIPVEDLYSGRIIRDRAGEWQVIGFIDGSERDEVRGVN